MPKAKRKMGAIERGKGEPPAHLTEKGWRRLFQRLHRGTHYHGSNLAYREIGRMYNLTAPMVRTIVLKGRPTDNRVRRQLGLRPLVLVQGCECGQLPHHTRRACPLRKKRNG